MSALKIGKSVYTDAELTIKKAASRARGDRLRKLYDLCETQQTVSTSRLLRLVNELAESDTMDAMHFYALAKFVRDHTEQVKQ